MNKRTKKTELLPPVKQGELVKGKIIKFDRGAAFLDLGPKGAGIVYGKELLEAKECLGKLNLGNDVAAKVIEVDNEDGYVELSLTRARKELIWQELQEKKDKGEIIKAKIIGANKGGLLARVSGILSFLPVSQLSSSNYPKVRNGDKAEILRALQKFVGQTLEVKIFDILAKQERVILSEKIKEAENRKKALEKYKPGDVVEGKITGLTDFGAFIAFGEARGPEPVVEGLIHISELSENRIQDPSEIVKQGQIVQARVIDISGDKVALSLKAMGESE